MKCPKCGQELEDNMKFCVKCGSNIEEAVKEQEERQARIEEERKKEEAVKQAKLEEEKRKEELRLEKEKIEEERRKLEEEKKKLEEEKLRAIREEEEIKRLKQEQEEKEKQVEENAKKSIEASEREKEVKKQENSETAEEEKLDTGFKPAKNQNIEKHKKKGKGFFGRLFDRLILIIILIAIILGGLYYLNVKGYLPEEVSNQINSLIDQIKDVKEKLNKDYENEDITLEEKIENEDDIYEWGVENTIEADDILDLDSEVSAIVVDEKYGIIDNQTGKILLDTKYDNIYKDISGNIVVVDDQTYSKVDSKYQPTGETPADIASDYVTNYYIYNTEDEEYYILDYEMTHIAKLSSKVISGIVICEEVSIPAEKMTENKDETYSYTVSSSDITFTGKYGLYDVDQNKKITDFLYTEISDESDGFYAAKRDSVAGFISSNGAETYYFALEETRSVHNGLAWAKCDGKWGLVKIVSYQ